MLGLSPLKGYRRQANRRSCLPERTRQRLACVAVAASKPRDASAFVVENVVTLALKSRLKRQASVSTEVYCTSLGILGGRLEGARVTGEDWESPFGLTARLLEADVGEVALDYPAVLARQRIVLRNIPKGRFRVLFTGADFGAFLRHPLFVQSAATACQGKPFVFDRTAVVSPPAPNFPYGYIHFSGTWSGNGKAYQLRMVPISPTQGVQVTAAWVQPDGSLIPDEFVSGELSRFFNGLTINLQGPELRFSSMRVVQHSTASGPGANRNGSSVSVLELHLSLRVLDFPPLNLKF